VLLVISLSGMLVSVVVAKLSPGMSKPVNMTISASKTAKLFAMVLNYTPSDDSITFLSMVGSEYETPAIVCPSALLPLESCQTYLHIL
jgi:hypothetical protein